MGGEGSILHSIYTLKANRALRRSKQRKFLNGGVEKPTRYLHQIHNPKCSEQEMESIKKAIRKKIKRENTIVNIIGAVLFLMALLLVLLFWHYIF